MKGFLPIILIIVAIGLFFFKVNPLYKEVNQLRADAKAYDEAIETAKELEDIRARLSERLESFSQSDLARLDHFLPRRLDTVRTILDVDGIASRHGLRLTNLGVVDSDSKGGASSGKTSYNTVAVKFDMTTTYEKAKEFLADIEKSLRLFDSAAVVIKPASGGGLYDFGITLNTYWIER